MDSRVEKEFRRHRVRLTIDGGRSQVASGIWEMRHRTHHQGRDRDTRTPGTRQTASPSAAMTSALRGCPVARRTIRPSASSTSTVGVFRMSSLRTRSRCSSASISTWRRRGRGRPPPRGRGGWPGRARRRRWRTGRASPARRGSRPTRPRRAAFRRRAHARVLSRSAADAALRRRSPPRAPPRTPRFRSSPIAAFT